MIPSGISLGRDIRPAWYAHAFTLSLWPVESRAEGTQEGRTLVWTKPGVDSRATGRPWELGAGEDPARRAQGSEQRWRRARESARSPFQSLWMLDVRLGGRAASGLRVPPLPVGPGGKPGGRKAPCDWGELGEDHEVRSLREWLWPRAGPAPRGSGSQAVEGGPTPSGLLGSVPSELGRRKGPGPRESCEDVEGSWGAGAGPKEPSGPSSPLHPGPMLT